MRPHLALRSWLILAALWVAAGIRAATFLSGLPSRATQLDFSHYYVSAAAAREGLNPYTDDLRPTAGRLGLDIAYIDREGYPPTFLL